MSGVATWSRVAGRSWIPTSRQPVHHYILLVHAVGSAVLNTRSNLGDVAREFNAANCDNVAFPM